MSRLAAKENNLVEINWVGKGDISVTIIIIIIIVINALKL
jgi:hypothetical protein